MSGRLLKKVLKEQEEAVLAQQHHLNNSGDESDSPDSPIPSSSKNPFDLLNDNDNDQDQGNESDTADEYPAGKADEKEPFPVKAPINTVSSSNHKSKKKKKKKTKEESFSSTVNKENPLNAMLENLSLGAGSSSCQQGHSKVKRANVNVGDSRVMKQCAMSSLQVDPKFLSAENELRRIFGSKVVNSFEKNNQTGSSRQIRGGRRGSHNHRKTILVSSSDHWPRWDGSFSMELVETRDGYNYFRYVHPASYSQAQRAFEAAQAINDLNGVASILLYHPYHIDSLVTLAEYFKFSGEHQMSADATAKILYAFECAWHPMFSPLQGNCQLKYTHDTNKPFLDTLFVHMKNMDRRGCHRAAVEICKLLLSLDSDDPKGALRCIDYFSIRAEEYKWLEHFSEEYKRDNSLWLFPNFSFSLAISRFYLERTEKDDAKASSTDLMKQALMLHPPVCSFVVAAAIQNKKQTYVLHPSLFFIILAKVNIKRSIDIDILVPNFIQSSRTVSLLLEEMVNMLQEVMHLIWKLIGIQWLAKDIILSYIGLIEGNVENNMCERKLVLTRKKNEQDHLLPREMSGMIQVLAPRNLINKVNIFEYTLRVCMQSINASDEKPFFILSDSIFQWFKILSGNFAT
ncbi:hypothetical protein LguiA_010557 [Lonicera macranthoides]